MKITAEQIDREVTAIRHRWSQIRAEHPEPWAKLALKYRLVIDPNLLHEIVGDYLTSHAYPSDDPYKHDVRYTFYGLQVIPHRGVEGWRICELAELIQPEAEET